MGCFFTAVGEAYKVTLNRRVESITELRVRPPSYSSILERRNTYRYRGGEKGPQGRCTEAHSKLP
eukprot:6152884-Prymnesium_polylepis.1